MKASITDLVEHFPQTRIAFIVASDLQITEDRPDTLAAQIAETETACRAAYDREQVGQIPAISVWRDAYKGFGVKKTSYRSSVERLMRNVLNDKPLADINALVDCYNRVSVAHIMPIGADDLDKVDGDICFRYAVGGDSFIALGQQQPDPPKIGEVVYADGTKVLCRRWNWYQDARSAVSTATTRAVLTIQSQGVGDLDAAVIDLTLGLQTFCGAKVTSAIADAAQPNVEI